MRCSGGGEVSRRGTHETGMGQCGGGVEVVKRRGGVNGALKSRGRRQCGGGVEGLSRRGGENQMKLMRRGR